MTRSLGWLVPLVVMAACSEDAPLPVVDAGPPPRASVARMTQRSGTVTITRDGAPHPAALEPLFEGDVVTTAEDGHALLQAGTREVELQPASSLRVSASLADLTVVSGELTFEDTAGGTFSTPSGAARTQPGGTVKLALGDQGPVFSIGSGTFELLDVGDGGSQTVSAGQRFVVGSGVLEFEASPEPPQPPPAPAASALSLLARGRVTVKAKSGKLLTIAPGQLTELTEAGTVEVAPGGQLRIESKGAVIALEGGAKGVVEPRADAPYLAASLQRGAMRVFLAEGQSVLLGDKKPIALTAKSASTAVITPGKGSPRIDLLGGDAEATTPSGQTVALDSAKRVSTLKLNPGRGQVFWGKPGDVTLAFPEGPGVMEVATDAEFKNLLVSASGDDELTVPAPLRGALYWRRRGDQTVSRASFDRDEYAGTVSAKTDTVAETGLKATVMFQSAVPSLTFTFPPSPGTSTWRFRLYGAADLKTPLVERKVSENRVLVESGTLKEGSYFWSATPLEKSGAERPGGRMNKMDIVFDNSLTRLVLTSPRDGEKASTAVGVAPVGARVTLNGKPVPVDAGGRFSAPIGNASLLVFRVVSRDGTEAQWVRRVAR